MSRALDVVALEKDGRIVRITAKAANQSHRFYVKHDDTQRAIHRSNDDQ